MGRINSSTFYKILASRLHRSPKYMTEYFENGVIPIIMSEIYRGNSIVIQEFGTFEPQVDGGYDAPNGRYIEEYINVVFKPSKTFIDMLNDKSDTPRRNAENIQKRIKTIADIRKDGRTYKNIGLEEIQKRLTPIIEDKLGKKDWRVNRKLKELNQNKNQDLEEN